MRKKIKIQIKSLAGSVLFEYEKEDNTIKDTLVEAVKTDVNLFGADLCGADLRCANLRHAYLYGADLRCADLRCADLGGVNLRHAYLYGANLGGAYLRGAHLADADLRCAYLEDANLKGAYLRGAVLEDTYLYSADLGGADLGGAHLYGANLRGVKEIPHIPLACPSDGAFIGWKKVSGKLIKLEIPEDAHRSSATSNKCRCDKAKVLAITDVDGSNPIDEIINNEYFPVVTYKVGEMVFPDSFDEDRWNECSHGIHFFINKQDAIDYLW